MNPAPSWQATHRRAPVAKGSSAMAPAHQQLGLPVRWLMAPLAISSFCMSG